MTDRAQPAVRRRGRRHPDRTRAPGVTIADGLRALATVRGGLCRSAASGRAALIRSPEVPSAHQRGPVRRTVHGSWCPHDEIRRLHRLGARSGHPSRHWRNSPPRAGTASSTASSTCPAPMPPVPMPLLRSMASGPRSGRETAARCRSRRWPPTAPRRAQQIRDAGLGYPRASGPTRCATTSERGRARVGRRRPRSARRGCGSGCRTSVPSRIRRHVRPGPRTVCGGRQARCRPRGQGPGGAAPREHRVQPLGGPALPRRPRPRRTSECCTTSATCSTEGQGDTCRPGWRCSGDYLAHVHVKNGRWATGRPAGGRRARVDGSSGRRSPRARPTCPELFGALKTARLRRLGVLRGLLHRPARRRNAPPANLATLRALADG